jgi:hypothetical protein
MCEVAGQVPKAEEARRLAHARYLRVSPQGAERLLTKFARPKCDQYGSECQTRVWPAREEA